MRAENGVLFMISIENGQIFSARASGARECLLFYRREARTKPNHSRSFEGTSGFFEMCHEKSLNFLLTSRRTQTTFALDRGTAEIVQCVDFLAR